VTPAFTAYRPDFILRDEWIPDVPEVNAPGDDDRDDGSNPWASIMARWREIPSGTDTHDVEAMRCAARAQSCR
jgi:hypothetical protein